MHRGKNTMNLFEYEKNIEESVVQYLTDNGISARRSRNHTDISTDDVETYFEYGGSLDDTEKCIHPNDDVNKSQSSNDTFPTGMHIAAYKMIVETSIPAIELLRNTLAKNDAILKNAIENRLSWCNDGINCIEYES